MSPSANDVLAGLDFSGAVRDIQKGLILKPVLHNYLFDAKFPDFSIHFRKHEMHREPDGWFHPSTHPTWHPRALYHYLAHPGHMPVERKAYMSTLSVTVGTAMHGFLQHCMADAGVLPASLQECHVCPPGTPPHEPGVIDEEAGERGHMDGLLDLSGLSVPGREFESPVFEFKTSNQMKLSKVDDLDLETYRAKWPDYYAQNQSYMRMSGRRMTVVFFMAMGYPWEMREFHVPFDPAFALGIRRKYIEVRQAFADGMAPDSCCGKPKACPAAGLCRTAEAKTMQTLGGMAL